MSPKKTRTQKPRGKLTVNKETIRDLTPSKTKARQVCGGATASREGVIHCN